MDIPNLKKQNKNKKIFIVNKIYKSYLLRVIKNAFENFSNNGIPLTIDDFYWEFMFYIPQIIDEYDESKIKFENFIGIKCKFFVLNTCKKFLTKAHQVMNGFSEFDDDLVSKNTDLFSNFTLEDSDEEITIDFSILTQNENKIYKYHFIDNFSIEEVSRILNISRYKIEKIIMEIGKKLLKFSPLNKK